MVEEINRECRSRIVITAATIQMCANRTEQPRWVADRQDSMAPEALRGEAVVVNVIMLFSHPFTHRCVLGPKRSIKAMNV